MPAIRILILPCLLDPLEDLEEGLELNLAISQVDALQAAFRALAPAFHLKAQEKKQKGEENNDNQPLK